VLLCKHDRHVAHNLVLRNLANHSHINFTPQDSPQILHDALPTATPTNCVNGTTDRFVNVNSTSCVSDSQALVCENVDPLASGDAGSLCTNSLPSDAAIDLLQNGRSSELNNILSSCHSNGTTLLPETETRHSADSVTGANIDLHDPSVCKVTSADVGSFECRSSCEKSQTLASLSSSYVRSLSLSSQTATDVPIQQVVYTYVILAFEYSGPFSSDLFLYMSYVEFVSIVAIIPFIVKSHYIPSDLATLVQQTHFLVWSQLFVITSSTLSSVCSVC